MTEIPLVDLRTQDRELASEIAEAISGVVRGGSFILGKEVAEFERAYADFSGARHCVGVANGTDALELCLRAIRIRPGEEVILPANTFIATALAVARLGAIPVLVDSDPEYHLIDPGRFEAAITPKTRAIIPVHLFGQIGPMEEIQTIAAPLKLAIVEDAAQAQGASRLGKPVGSWGIGAATSFYPSKNLGAYGDAGAVTTNSDEFAAQLRALRNYGSDRKYHHPQQGFNSRLDTLQAAVLSIKLRYLSVWNQARREAAERYHRLLADLPEVRCPHVAPGNQHVWHLYVIRLANRDAVLQTLQKSGIGAGVHYPIPLHLQGALRHRQYRLGDFPVAERAAAEILSLPLFPGITAEQQSRVVAEIRRALR